MTFRGALSTGVLLAIVILSGSSSIKSGVDLVNLDPAVRPQDDLFRYGNGRYEYRANGPVSHLPGFYEAFGVTASDRLFRSPATRVRMW